MRKGSRRRTNNRGKVALMFVCSSIIVGMVGGLSINMAQSDTGKNPQFIEQSGSMYKNSNVSVEVVDKKGNGGNGTTTHPGSKPGLKPGGNHGSGSNVGHGGDSSSNNGARSGNNVDGNDETPAVIVDEYGNNEFPQTGAEKDNLSLIGAVMLGAPALLLAVKKLIQLS
ncbi:LPXTG cell wall anchor domain-containing protein [Companilactobacillus ginsenosidimutans]|uniref:Uncharacterized protein n=1 Tax=Companilactobacillus ginsenosidimutans TaxID=1007676 RepID=A0A0H4QJF5_9LACO|nr:LPXTG cell wall anchor domain-containing protein [Companilactobacillus ginsenosidimutans]AKP68052.1 hypothetical protein ABM34_11240 [Companilactobacillus ginsenosidimutans]